MYVCMYLCLKGIGRYMQGLSNQLILSFIRSYFPYVAYRISTFKPTKESEMNSDNCWFLTRENGYLQDPGFSIHDGEECLGSKAYLCRRAATSLPTCMHAYMHGFVPLRNTNTASSSLGCILASVSARNKVALQLEGDSPIENGCVSYWNLFTASCLAWEHVIMAGRWMEGDVGVIILVWYYRSGLSGLWGERGVGYVTWNLRSW